MLYGVLIGQVLIETAEKAGIPWTSRYEMFESKQSQFDCLYSEVFDQSVDYPSYYTQEFHAYDSGNLNWKAAYECESATMSMALRVWPKEPLTYADAQSRLRSSFLNTLGEYASKTAMKSRPKRILDVGCSVGVSTFYLAEYFKSASSIVGLDLSPHFLSIAKFRQALLQQPGSSNDDIAVEGVGTVTTVVI